MLGRQLIRQTQRRLSPFLVRFPSYQKRWFKEPKIIFNFEKDPQKRFELVLKLLKEQYSSSVRQFDLVRRSLTNRYTADEVSNNLANMLPIEDNWVFDFAVRWIVNTRLSNDNVLVKQMDEIDTKEYNEMYEYVSKQLSYPDNEEKGISIYKKDILTRISYVFVGRNQDDTGCITQQHFLLYLLEKYKGYTDRTGMILYRCASLTPNCKEDPHGYMANALGMIAYSTDKISRAIFCYNVSAMRGYLPALANLYHIYSDKKNYTEYDFEMVMFFIRNLNEYLKMNKDIPNTRDVDIINKCINLIIDNIKLIHDEFDKYVKRYDNVDGYHNDFLGNIEFVTFRIMEKSSLKEQIKYFTVAHNVIPTALNMAKIELEEFIKYDKIQQKK